MSSPAFFSSRFSSLYRTTGLILPLVAAASVAAAWVQHTSSRLPSAYSWGRLFYILSIVVERPHLPAYALGAFLIGVFRRRGEWQIERVSRAFSQRIDVTAEMPRILRLFGFGLVSVVADLAFCPFHDALDVVCVALGGASLGFERPSVRKISRVALHFALVLGLLTFVSYVFTVAKALLFTVEVPQDVAIQAFERKIFGGNPDVWLSDFARTRPALVTLADRVYFHLFEHMTVLSLLLVGMRLARERVQLISALSLCYLIGGPAYYLWPGVGPVFWEPARFAYLNRPDLLAPQVQADLLAATNAMRQGIATELSTYAFVACMPSLHMAQEFVMLWYARRSRLGLFLSIIFTTATVFAIQILGFHYAIDTLFGGVLAAIAIAICRWQEPRLLPARISIEDEELPPRGRPFWRRAT